MKIKALLTTLCVALGCISSYGQTHHVPPRKEIRHKLQTHPQDNTLQQIATRASGEYIMAEFPTIGEIKGVVILAAFADVPFSTDTIGKLLSDRYNADNYSERIKFNEYSDSLGQYCELDITLPGSARDYFRTQSFGKFVPSFDVIGPVTLDYPRAHYGENTSSGNDKNTSGMIREACQKAYNMGLTDFTDYDNDGDGIVDVVYVVYAGSDEAQTGIKESIWAKASSISLILGDMSIKRYACSSELVIDLPVVAGIGTFVHEFSHVLGLPDFYNTKADDFTMDIWSVMDYGMYNAEGFIPCAYTAFERYSLGWLPMQTLDAPATLSIGTTDEEGKGYRIFTAAIDSTSLITETDTASFYLIETIRQEGWNLYAAANGLLISEVTYDSIAWRSNKVNVNKHRHCIVPANNSYNYRTAPKHLFGNTNHEFTMSSTPASITQFGAAMNKPLTDINYDATTGKTTFHFCRGSLVNGLDNLNCHHSTLNTIYDLQGKPTMYYSRGIYIQDGKKYLQEDYK